MTSSCSLEACQGCPTSQEAFDRLHGALQYHVVNSMGWTGLRSTQADAVAPILAGKHCLILAPTAGASTAEKPIEPAAKRVTAMIDAKTALVLRLTSNSCSATATRYRCSSSMGIGSSNRLARK